MMLYSWGVIFTLLAHIFSSDASTQSTGFLSGFDSRTWLIIFINAFMGQVVSRVMKYADNIIKVFAGAFGVIVTMVISAQLFNYPVTLLFNLGAGVVFIASALFLVPSERLKQEY